MEVQPEVINNEFEQVVPNDNEYGYWDTALEDLADFVLGFVTGTDDADHDAEVAEQLETAINTLQNAEWMKDEEFVQEMQDLWAVKVASVRAALAEVAKDSPGADMEGSELEFQESNPLLTPVLLICSWAVIGADGWADTSNPTVNVLWRKGILKTRSKNGITIIDRHPHPHTSASKSPAMPRVNQRTKRFEYDCDPRIVTIMDAFITWLLEQRRIHLPSSFTIHIGQENRFLMEQYLGSKEEVLRSTLSVPVFGRDRPTIAGAKLVVLEGSHLHSSVYHPSAPLYAKGNMRNGERPSCYRQLMLAKECFILDFVFDLARLIIGEMPTQRQHSIFARLAYIKPGALRLDYDEAREALYRLVGTGRTSMNDVRAMEEERSLEGFTAHVEDWIEQADIWLVTPLQKLHLDKPPAHLALCVLNNFLAQWKMKAPVPLALARHEPIGIATSGGYPVLEAISRVAVLSHIVTKADTLHLVPCKSQLPIGVSGGVPLLIASTTAHALEAAGTAVASAQTVPAGNEVKIATSGGYPVIVSLGTQEALRGTIARDIAAHAIPNSSPTIIAASGGLPLVLAASLSNHLYYEKHDTRPAPLYSGLEQPIGVSGGHLLATTGAENWMLRVSLSGMRERKEEKYKIGGRKSTGGNAMRIQRIQEGSGPSLSASGGFLLLDVDTIEASHIESMRNVPSTFYISQALPRLAVSGGIPLIASAEIVWGAQLGHHKEFAVASVGENQIWVAGSGGYPLVSNVASVGGRGAASSRGGKTVPFASLDGYTLGSSGGLPLMLDGITRQVVRTQMTQGSTEADNAQPWMEDGVVLAGSAGLLFLFSAKENSVLKSQMTKYRQAQAAKPTIDTLDDWKELEEEEKSKFFAPELKALLDKFEIKGYNARTTKPALIALLDNA